VERLRDQAAKARRLAASVTDKMSQNALMHYADECEEHAAKLELIAEADQRRRIDGGSPASGLPPKKGAPE